MSNLSVFSFQGAHSVRVQHIGGEPWFVASDVCSALEIKNVSDALKSLDDDEKNTIALSYGKRGNPNVLIVSESGLYTLILRSRNAVNKGTPQWKFRKWITGEVLPAIRKTGSYSPAAAAPAREPLTGEQNRELTYIVGQIANQFHFKRAWVKGIWHAIRRSTGTRSPAALTVDDLPAVQRELRRIVAVTEQMKAVNEAIERDVLRLAVRGRQPAFSVLGKVGQYGRDNPFSTELPAKLEIMIEGLAAPVMLKNQTTLSSKFDKSLVEN